MLCVPWLDRPSKKTFWCALPPGGIPDPEAKQDPTLCGFAIYLRTGLQDREPTCPDCRKILGLPSITPGSALPEDLLPA